jgi:hypothetical protein
MERFAVGAADAAGMIQSWNAEAQRLDAANRKTCRPTAWQQRAERAVNDLVPANFRQWRRLNGILEQIAPPLTPAEPERPGNKMMRRHHAAGGPVRRPRRHDHRGAAPQPAPSNIACASSAATRFAVREWWSRSPGGPQDPR